MGSVFMNPIIVSKVVDSLSVDTAGYQTITNSGVAGNFVGANVPGIASDTYNISIAIDGVDHDNLAISILITDSWETILAAIQAALRTATSGLETVSIQNGKIKVTSATVGADSSVEITEGSTDGLLAAIEAATGYNITVDDAYNGVEGAFSFQLIDVPPTDFDVMFIGKCYTSAGVQKKGLIYSFSKTTGKLTVNDPSGGALNLAVGDKLAVACAIGLLS